MKTRFVRHGILGGVLSLGILSTQTIYCQTKLQFTGNNATPENAIQLFWASTNHELYAVQYANALATNADGSTAWNTLYDQYPSHGTNTFIGDFGNYDVTPAIPHPKYAPMRFYRIVDEGADNDTTDNPSITITSPTNGSVLSGQITVTVVATCSNLPVVTTKLYVDGQEMNESDDGSNYVINTCEWLNGSHTLFALATARSGLSGPSGNYPIYTSHGVSAYMPVTFSNLISGIAFSQPFFEPSLGQTQEVTATFAANCNWTLQIQDQNSNIVRNASGGGTSMTFDWDGKGDGETNIPDGVYYYYISAETNGESGEIVGGGSGGGSGGSPPSPSFARSSALNSSSTMELWAVPADLSGTPVPAALYPPGIDTSGLIIFEATPAEIQSLRPSVSRAKSATAMNSGNGMFADNASPAYSGPSAQATTAPTRPPTAPTKNAAGTYGIASFSWPTPQTVSIPNNGASGVCHLDGVTGSSVYYTPIPEQPNFELNFLRTMSKAGWKVEYDRSDSLLHAQDMRRSDLGYGGGELFTTANIGLFLDHGNYGTDPDYSAGANGSYQTYFYCGNSNSYTANVVVAPPINDWLRMCQIGFGGNLKWMGLMACDSLTTFDSMSGAGAIPLKTTHMVCGCASIAGIGQEFGQYWAHNMLVGGFFTGPETIANAWFDAGRKQYLGATNLPTVIFRVAAYQECIGDKIKNNTDPTTPSPTPGNLIKSDAQVFP